MSEKMTKMQACGALCELQEHIKKQKKYHTDRIAEEDLHIDYHKNETAKFDKWLRAIEMAGVALTR